MKRRQDTAIALVAILTMATGAWAQDNAANTAVSIELNAVKSNDTGCTLSFLVVNEHDSPIEKAVYETVLFDSTGQVDRLTLFDFGTLPPGRPRVRQFSIPGLACDGLGQVLINGAHTCDAPELAETACETDLRLNTRTDIEVIG